MTLQKFDHVLLRKWRGESESGGRRAEVAEMKGGGAIYLNYIHFSLKKTSISDRVHLHTLPIFPTIPQKYSSLQDGRKSRVYFNSASRQPIMH
jgi:hypothetical protein